MFTNTMNISIVRAVITRPLLFLEFVYINFRLDHRTAMTTANTKERNPIFSSCSISYDTDDLSVEEIKF